MGISNEIPFLPESALCPTTLEKGWALGQEFVDSRNGYKYRLYQISSALTNSKFAAGEVAVFESDLVVTNDVSAGADATYPEAAGIASAAYDQSTGTTTVRYALFLVSGLYSTVKTDAGDDIAAGDLVVADETVDGAVDRAPKATDGLTAFGVLKTLVGRARAADVDANDTVSVAVDIRR